MVCGLSEKKSKIIKHLETQSVMPKESNNILFALNVPSFKL